MPWIPKPKKKRKVRTPRDKEQQRKSQEVYQSSAYQRLRSQMLHEQPTCVCCERLFKRVTLAEEVHHVTEILNGVTKGQRMNIGLDPNNLICLCQKCHKQVHLKKIKIDNDFEGGFEIKKTKLFVDGVDDIRI